MSRPDALARAVPAFLSRCGTGGRVRTTWQSLASKINPQRHKEVDDRLAIKSTIYSLARHHSPVFRHVRKLPIEAWSCLIFPFADRLMLTVTGALLGGRLLVFASRMVRCRGRRLRC